MITRVPRRRQWFVGDCVVAGVAREIITARLASCANRAAAIEIQTKLQAVRMKTAAPIERLLGSKIMPLDAHA